jgi:hypothetical protein
MSGALHFSGWRAWKNRASCVLGQQARSPQRSSAENRNHPVGKYGLFRRRALIQSLPAASVKVCDAGYAWRLKPRLPTAKPAFAG